MSTSKDLIMKQKVKDDIINLTIIKKIIKGFCFGVNSADEISISLKDWREVEDFFTKYVEMGL